MNNTISPYGDLANAIILQAVKDYRKALRKLNKHPRNESALNTKCEVERFFRSEWYTLLTKVNPEILISKLNEEVSK